MELFDGAVKLKEEESLKVEGCTFIPVYNKNQEKLGYVNSCKTNGYNGEIKFVIGITTDGKISGVQIVKSSETGGLGGIIEEKKWLDMWKGRDVSYEFNEETDCEAGATTSPRAVYKEMNRVLGIYDKIK